MNREKLNAAIFEAARHTGITADQAERFVGTLEICGISLSAIAAPPAPAKDGWISVEERLPEENGEYAVFLKPMLGGSFVSVSSYYKTAHAAISGWDTSRVLAWQPLPLPPKE